MRVSMHIVAYVVFALAGLSTARMSLGRHRSEELSAAADTFKVAQKQGAMKVKELTWLQSETSKMDSDIADVQNKLHSAFVQLNQLLESTPPAADKLKNATVAPAQSVKKAGKPPASFPAMAAVNKSLKVAKVASVAKVRKDGGSKGRIEQEKAVLDKLFKHLKSNIVKLNSQERDGKKASEQAVQRLQARLKKDEAALQKKGLTAFEHQLLVNRTKTEEFEIKYWSGDRSLGHSVFHDNLKITHGLMGRVQNLLSAYKQAAAKGHVDKDLMKKVQAQVEPKVFMQMRDDLEDTAQSYYSNVLMGMQYLQ